MRYISLMIENYIDVSKMQKLLTNLAQADRETFESHLNEAKFFFPLIKDDLYNTKLNSKILEIGSGVGFLSSFLSADGFSVTSIEPSAAGFESLPVLQRILKDSLLTSNSCAFLDSTAETFRSTEEFEYIFSINVMEHVLNITIALENITKHLSKKGSYRFICPNYWFPYEPHFGLISFPSKKLTKKIFGRKITQSKFTNSDELWEGLNWINPNKITSSVNKNTHKIEFSNLAYSHYIDSLKSDHSILTRKSRAFSFLAYIVRFINPIILKIFPSKYLPVLDVTITKL